MRFHRRAALGLGSLLLGTIGLTTLLGQVQSQTSTNVPKQQPTSILFENVRIFNGTSDQLSGPPSVLVVGNKIEKISNTPLNLASSAKLTKIEGGGRVLMPGLIDNHVHLFLTSTRTVERRGFPNLTI